MEIATISIPGCYHSAAKYLSELTGISINKEVVFHDMNDLYNHSKGRGGKIVKKLKFRSSKIQVEDDNGSRLPYFNMQSQKRFDLEYPDFKPVKFIISVMRSQHEFNYPIQSAGSHRDSLGGGWYSNVEMVKINDKYFANIECRCY